MIPFNIADLNMEEIENNCLKSKNAFGLNFVIAGISVMMVDPNEEIMMEYKLHNVDDIESYAVGGMDFLKRKIKEYYDKNPDNFTQDEKDIMVELGVL